MGAPVGIIGLGIMGGAPLASSTAVAQQTEVIITSLPASAALNDAVAKISRAKPRIVIEMSTLPLADKERVRRRLASRMSAPTATARA